MMLISCEVERPVSVVKPKQIAARIVPHKLDRKANDRIEQRVSENHLSAKTFAFVQP